MILDCIGFGALNVDKLYRVERIARPGEEVAVFDQEQHLGGSAANTIVGLSRLGHRVGYIGKVADDQEGRLHIKSLSAENVDTSRIIVTNNGHSGNVIGFVDSKGERTLYVAPGVNDTLSFEEIDHDYAAKTNLIHISSFVGEQPFIAQRKLLEAISSVKVSFDPGNLYAHKGLEALRPFLRKCLVVFPNESELRILTGEGPEEGARTLLNQGAAIVAVKLGEDGCYVTDGRESDYVTAYRTNIVDTTGAGDAFCAGFLHGLISGKGIRDSGRLGNLVASMKLSKAGARVGLPHIQELKNEMNRIKQTFSGDGCRVL
ncbi:carbohydrate kinase family protein [Candidatus Bathyarchaeota archaeon]|jgi:ribokinase|nr:carbohydrate kinase family protein [Candidatus Bathyarchaeota archaeon]